MEKELFFENLSTFYDKCFEVNKSVPEIVKGYENNEKRDDYDWIGLEKEEILKSKFSYKKGLDELAQIQKDVYLGGKNRKYIYDELDGDDMNYERYMDSLPCLKKRIFKQGSGVGKFITIHVNVSESACVQYSEMLNKSYTVMRLIDVLEDEGYRVQVLAESNINKLGPGIENLHMKVVIKKFEDPLIKGQILTAISPWFLRFWMFHYWTGHFICSGGLGYPAKLNKVSTTSEIYFDSGEALNEDKATEKINNILHLFEKEEN